MSFGYKTAWFAIHGTDIPATARALGLTPPAPSTAEPAIAAASDGNGKVFISPAIRGWTLIMSSDFLDLAGESSAPFLDVLRRVSAELDTEAQFFATYRVSDAYLWARARRGDIVRAFFNYQGEQMTDIGAPTTEEIRLGYRFFDGNSADASMARYWERKDLTFVDEDHVLQIAGLWSIDPRDLDLEAMPNGFIADRVLPPANRPAPPAAVNSAALTPAAKPWWRRW